VSHSYWKTEKEEQGKETSRARGGERGKGAHQIKQGRGSETTWIEVGEIAAYGRQLNVVSSGVDI